MMSLAPPFLLGIGSRIGDRNPVAWNPRGLCVSTGVVQYSSGFTLLKWGQPTTVVPAAKETSESTPKYTRGTPWCDCS